MGAGSVRTSTKMIAIACAVATGPLLAHAAIGIRDYVSAGPSEPDEDGFSLDGDGVFVDPGTSGGLSPQCVWDGSVCVVTGGGWDDDWWPGGGGGGGSGGDSGGGDCSTDPSRCEGNDPPPPSPENPMVCERGSGKVHMTFDGRTIRVTARYAPNSAHAASVEAYVAGIERVWTVDFPDANIGMEVDLVPDPNGFMFRFSPEYVNRAGLQWLGGTDWEMQLGALGSIAEAEVEYFMRVAGHEFGHFWFGANLPDGAELPLSIMANARHGQVLPSDLASMVEACRTGGYAG